MTAARPRPGVAVVVSVVAVLLIVSASVAAVFAMSTETGPAHPDQWDPRVADLARFVEVHRGDTFDHPVQVDFLTPDEYSKAARAETSNLSDQEKKDLETSQGELRALGLASGDVDLRKAFNDLSDSGTLAFYDPDTERVSVRGTDMTVEQRVTLVHELTHALQDQKFDISTKRENDLKTDGQQTALRALLEGDATRIENDYVDQLSDAEQSDYRDANQKSVDSAQSGLANVPNSLQALQQAPYLLGASFVEILADNGGNTSVDDAFRSPPSTEEQLFEPAVYQRHEGARDVKAPDLPDGVKDTTDNGDFGATSWFLMLAERIDPVQALHAVDGWGGDAFVSYDDDGGRTCMRIAFVGDTPHDETEMRDALQEWAAAMPAGSAELLPGDAPLVVQTCDPGQGKEAPLTNRGLDAIAMAGLRSAEMQAAVKLGGLSADKAFGFGDCVISTLGIDWVHQANAANGGLPDSLLADRDSAEQTCIAKSR